jgi:hypothetical protein
MGGGSYSDAAYTARSVHHAKTGTSFFKHDADIRSGHVAATVHASLDPAGLNKAGVKIRESRDSDEHPNSRAVAVIFDETGSMSEVPGVFKDALPKLMALLVKKGYLADPHVLLGAVGDAYSDRVPLQIGQFESGNEMDEALANIYLEGNGGGQQHESYALAMYFMAKYTAMDCLEKRGQKGYLFMSGDELPYGLGVYRNLPAVEKAQVKRLIGDDIQGDLTFDEVWKMLNDKFEVFWIFPKQGSYFNHRNVVEPLKKLFGERFIALDEASDICETIATAIGVAEGYDVNDVTQALVDVGADPAAAKRAGKALALYSKSGAVMKGAKADGALVATGSDAVERL